MYNIHIEKEILLSEFYIAQYTYMQHNRNLQGIKYTDEKEENALLETVFTLYFDKNRQVYLEKYFCQNFLVFLLHNIDLPNQLFEK